MGGGVDEDFTAVVGMNVDTTGVVGTTLCVTNNFPYVRLDTESSGGMAPASTQAPPPSFDRKRIGNAISVDRIVSPSRVKGLGCRFEEEWYVWDRILQDL